MKTEDYSLKQCFKCGEVKALSAFYKHKGMADGRVNKCKECNKKDVKGSRERNIEKVREYDRKRGNRMPNSYQKEYRKRYPRKARARRMVAYHIKKGDLRHMPCEVCGETENIHAHHDDYSQPLNVRWLCAAHHHQWHAENGEGANP